MKKILSIMTAAMLGTAVSAQETYDNAQLATKDLNGTARYVGMGGAMEALGADLSTIGTNPAGIGMFRRGMVAGSFGFNTLSDAKSFGNANKTNMSFDQAGFVYSMRSGRHSMLNFGFNYTKSKNFDQILTAAGRLNNASQNKLSAMKNANGVYTLQDKNNGLVSNSGAYSQADYLYSNVLFNHYKEPAENKPADPTNAGLKDGVIVYDNTGLPVYYNATGYDFGRSTTGYIGQYDFNVSGNSNDRFYWGFTVGIYDVHYNSSSLYSESLVDGGKAIGDVAMNDERKITGTGFDVKAGLIFRPAEESPFRIGLYVHTPTWYDLTTRNYTVLNNNTNEAYGSTERGKSSESYDFKFYTPWRFGVSLGHTVGNYLALGATYEYADYTTNDIRVNDGGEVDYWGNYYETSSRDEAMKQNIKNSLKGVHTVKLGMEFKPEKNFAVRLGYNYQSAMYNKNGFKDGSLESYGTYYASTTDYTNWKDTHRFTAGVGYNYGKFSFDLAYQYSQTNGDFYPFMSYVDNSEPKFDNVCDAVKVSNKRNQLLFTVGYKF
ncbi:MAG: hemin receptor [Prevotella sp.]|uniref:hemin receptor n=1 Tax=Prevotella sp. TaxID=59823 RepID=UPI0025F8A28C|nr:hemin receptor [Prevotella sp.]MCI7183426.1 hemin receptor [Prevotella sp.]